MTQHPRRWYARADLKISNAIVGEVFYFVSFICDHPVSYCSPKNLEGTMQGGGLGSHQLSLNVLDLAPGLLFHNLECPGGR